jgi:hypothetical protein
VGNLAARPVHALAEETGRIVPLGTWALRQATAGMRQWRDRLGSQAPRYASVNISARQFGDPGFAHSVQQDLVASGLEPPALMLELTETVPLSLTEQISGNLAQLKAIGIRLARRLRHRALPTCSSTAATGRRVKDRHVPAQRGSCRQATRRPAPGHHANCPGTPTQDHRHRSRERGAAGISWYRSAAATGRATCWQCHCKPTRQKHLPPSPTSRLPPVSLKHRPR